MEKHKDRREDIKNFMNENNEKFYFIKHLKWATGDMIALAAAVMMFPKLVIVLQNHDDERREQVLAFYKSNDLEVRNFEEIKVMNTSNNFREKMFGFNIEKIYGFVYQKGSGQTILNQIKTQMENKTCLKVFDMELVTQLIGEASLKDLNIVRKKWCSQELAPNYSFSSYYPVFLWSRLSGAKGKAHIEYDSTYPYLWSLGRKLSEAGYSPIMIGDSPEKPEYLETFFHGISSNSNELFEFWKTSHPLSRVDQFQYVDKLSRRFSINNSQLSRALHIGFRSGNLEAMAIMGHTVLYIECQSPEFYEDFGSPRMECWNDLTNIYYKKMEISIPVSIGGLQKLYAKINTGNMPTVLNEKDTKNRETALMFLAARDGLIHYWGSATIGTEHHFKQNISENDMKRIFRQVESVYPLHKTSSGVHHLI